MVSPMLPLTTSLSPNIGCTPRLVHGSLRPWALPPLRLGPRPLSRHSHQPPQLLPDGTRLTASSLDGCGPSTHPSLQESARCAPSLATALPGRGPCLQARPSTRFCMTGILFKNMVPQK